MARASSSGWDVVELEEKTGLRFLVTKDGEAVTRVDSPEVGKAYIATASKAKTAEAKNPSADGA